MFPAQKINLTCNESAVMYVPLKELTKSLLLENHNEKRSLLAQGKLDGEYWKKTAAIMPILVSFFPKI